MEVQDFLDWVWKYGILAAIGLAVIIAIGYASYRAYRYLSVWIPAFLDKHLTLMDTLDTGLKALTLNDTATTTAVSAVAASITASQINHEQTRSSVSNHDKASEANHLTTHGLVEAGFAKVTEGIEGIKQALNSNPALANKVGREIQRIETDTAIAQQKVG